MNLIALDFDQEGLVTMHIKHYMTCSGIESKFALDADIAGCFDNINHEVLIKKMGVSPYISKIVRQWLKAGIMDKNVFHPNEKGTPQGGVISPLLANIALHGLENLVKTISKNAYIVRYADDFVVLHNELEVIEQCKLAIESWLIKIGLELKPSKTRVINTLDSYDGQQAGFNFLGCNIRQYQVGKYKSGKRKKGFVTLSQGVAPPDSASEPSVNLSIHSALQ